MGYRENTRVLSLSVHDVVDLVLRRGNLDSRVFNQSSMAEGTRLHSSFQKLQGAKYISEYPLSLVMNKDGYLFELSGRADGVIEIGNSYIIDEIKTTVQSLKIFHDENGEWHLGQAIFYAYMLALEKSLSQVYVRLTYIHQLKEEENYIIENCYSFSQLEQYVSDVLNDYLEYVRKVDTRIEARNASVEALEFPYPSYRKGQKELIEFASENAKQGLVGYVEAPTGIGKTASVLFPYIKELVRSDSEKIFYLTSKNSIKESVYNLLNNMYIQGMKFSALFLTNKETLCLNDVKKHCNPDECPYAKNYYDKINKVIFEEIETRDVFTQADIIDIARTHIICPFEFQLDLSLYVDLIVGDYNYVYDPHVRLMRYFEEAKKRPYYLLVDEAHNLPSRTREMYSSEISILDFLNLRKNMPAFKGKRMKRILTNVINFFKNRLMYEDKELLEEAPVELVDLLTRFADRAKTAMRDEHEVVNDIFLDLYFKINELLSLPLDDCTHFAYYYSGHEGKTMSFSIKCLDTREIIKRTNNFFVSSLFFSATLSPRDYYISLFGGNDESNKLYLPSPFPLENRLVLIQNDISTYYKDRNSSLSELCRLIRDVTITKTGNYFVFFPSYEYMNLCKNMIDTYGDLNIIMQERNMDNYSRDEFLRNFKINPQKTTIGFIVMGGIFAEGIDLMSDRLIGAIIVGVGLPKITYENDLIKNYINNTYENDGFDYAYTYPGFNKVLQAAGRVIRSDTDRGIIVLADTRYRNSKYVNLYESVWPDAIISSNNDEAIAEVERFWEEER